jgi:ribosomal protein S18 acetylase RimI-like enzyme
MIRWAKPEDVGALAALVRAFAEDEQRVPGLEEADLQRDLFGHPPQAEALIAVDEATERVVGFAIFFMKYSTALRRPGMYIEDLYLAEEFRALGHGRALMAGLAHVAHEREAARIEWRVLKANARGIAFYSSLGAVALDDRTIFRLSGEALVALGREALSV